MFLSLNIVIASISIAFIKLYNGIVTSQNDTVVLSFQISRRHDAVYKVFPIVSSTALLHMHMQEGSMLPALRYDMRVGLCKRLRYSHSIARSLYCGIPMPS